MNADVTQPLLHSSDLTVTHPFADSVPGKFPVAQFCSLFEKPRTSAVTQQLLLKGGSHHAPRGWRYKSQIVHSLKLSFSAEFTKFLCFGVLPFMVK